MLDKAVLPAPAGHDEDRQFTSTLAKGMALLSCFREGDAMLANRDFVARTGFAKANVSRLAFTLVTLGFLRRDAATGKYRLGSPVLSMGYPLLAGMHIRQIARPYMRELADELSATVSMGVRDRAQMLFVETSRSAATRTGLADIGTARPLLGSAMGAAWLAVASPYERGRAINHAVVAADLQTERGIGQRIARGLKEFAANGYASSSDASASSLTVAVPLRSPIDSEIVVFDCSVRTPGKPSPPAVDALGRRLILTARSIEGAMSMR
jgi:DNA-binding IclR family transcriptional regulator